MSTSSPPTITPVVYFSSGAAEHPLRGEFMRHINRDELEEAERVLQEGTLNGAFGPFHQANLGGLLETRRGNTQKAESLFIEAEGCARTAVEKAATLQNRSLLSFQDGEWMEAIALIERGIVLAPMTEGLWVNLVYALHQAGAHDQLGAVLEKLPEVLDLRQGLCRYHLLHDPDLAGVRTHEVFVSVLRPILSL